ncbi:MAG TPA: histidine kinase [Streptosporangiaceae bacterium]|jgi:two-component system sensor histidine kinase DesK|nr:histidine kinase [Streptosporangiaceae bacterium]
MNADTDAAGPAPDAAGPAPDWAAWHNAWRNDWRRIAMSAVFLVYLAGVPAAVAKYTSGAASVAGYVILAAFCVCHLALLYDPWATTASRFLALFGTMVALTAAEAFFAHEAAFFMCAYLGIFLVARYGARAAPAIALMTLLAIVVPGLVPSWHDGFGTALDNFTAITIPGIALAMFGFFKVVQANHDLAEARSRIAALATESERTRIARDLHDLLGHSLTTITVKAGLARKLGAADTERALREIAEVEELSRRALSEVRMAVANYRDRDVSLAGEMANGRELLRAADITADLPRAVDVVGPRCSELFGWVLREGLTNVVRHSRASACAVRLTRDSVEITDDGTGGGGENRTDGGNGLGGLRERVEAAGGTLDAGPRPGGGWRLSVTLPPDTGTPETKTPETGTVTESSDQVTDGVRT